MSKQINELQKVKAEMLSSLSLLERANDTYEEEIGRLKSKEKPMIVHDSVNEIDEFSRTEKDNSDNNTDFLPVQPSLVNNISKKCRVMVIGDEFAKNGSNVLHSTISSPDITIEGIVKPGLESSDLTLSLFYHSQQYGKNDYIIIMFDKVVAMAKTRTASLSDVAATEQLIVKLRTNFSAQIEEKIEKKFSEFHDKLSELSESVKVVGESCKRNDLSIRKLQTSVNSLEQAMKRNSIRILGIDDKGNENPFLTASEFFSNCLGILSDINVSFRIGNTANKRSRPRVLLVSLSTSSKRNEIMRAKKFKLKGSNVTIYEDLTRDNFKLLQKAKKSLVERMHGPQVAKYM
nr:unnamed protein product [Callosobruchus analis]